MSEYTPKHRLDTEAKSPEGAAAANLFLSSLEYENMSDTYRQLVGQFEQESRGGGKPVELQMAAIALAYPALYQLISDMSGISQETGRHDARAQAFADGVEAGAVTLITILKFYIDVEKLERSIQD
jgi:hypothetical protein